MGRERGGEVERTAEEWRDGVAERERGRGS